MPQESVWQNLIAIEDCFRGDVTEARLARQTYAVYDTPDGITVSLARCSHQGANLCYGYFDGRTIECPLHQGLFDARSGKALAAPATRPLRMIEARICEGWVQINRPLQKPSAPPPDNGPETGDSARRDQS
ncbi:MAG: Rieske 2Fe-2S domain-containing protein [Rhodobacteraceae bacterium]|nr:Rieske 2Fe-2S domain-containing protein [Paracoccaceae bacterium]